MLPGHIKLGNFEENLADGFREAAEGRPRGFYVVSAFQRFMELRGQSDGIDFFIIDLAAGISPSALTLLDACHKRVIVVADEPSSIADAYGLIKVVCQRSKRDDKGFGI